MSFNKKTLILGQWNILGMGMGPGPFWSHGYISSPGQLLTPALVSELVWVPILVQDYIFTVLPEFSTADPPSPHSGSVDTKPCAGNHLSTLHFCKCQCRMSTKTEND